MVQFSSFIVGCNYCNSLKGESVEVAFFEGTLLLSFCSIILKALLRLNFLQTDVIIYYPEAKCSYTIMIYYTITFYGETELLSVPEHVIYGIPFAI
jgi:hypothetical protein